MKEGNESSKSLFLSIAETQEILFYFLIMLYFGTMLSKSRNSARPKSFPLQPEKFASHPKSIKSTENEPE